MTSVVVAAVPIWLEYGQFAIDNLSTLSEGMELPRTIYEKAIIAAGMHTSQVNIMGGRERERERERDVQMCNSLGRHDMGCLSYL